MRVITINTNGIRAAARKGFFDWMLAQKPDFVCIQETKAQEEQLGDAVFNPEGYFRYFSDAEKKGYSGTAIYTPHKPLKITTETGIANVDSEGRYVAVEYENLIVVSLYMPSGTSGDERQAIKYQMMDDMLLHFRELRATGKEVVVNADWNIAHTKKDIKNWRGNQKNSGFLPEERAWLDVLFGEEAWVDTFRCLNEEDFQYTWWSNRGQAWANNTGWRLDYQVCSKALSETATGESVYKDERFSDHSPLIIDYDFTINGV